MPLLNFFSKQVQKASPTADVNNIAGANKGGSCIAAAFLRVSNKSISLSFKKCWEKTKCVIFWKFVKGI